MAVALAVFDPYLFTGGDNVTYYALTRALATGQGYVNLIAPGYRPETVYPPGYPALLVPFYWVFGGSFVALKLQSLLGGAIVLVATWGIAVRDRGLPPWAPVAAVWLVGLAPVFLIYTHFVLSDMSYTAVAVLALWTFSHTNDGDPSGGPSMKWWVVGCLLMLLGFWVRTAGVALIGAVLCWALLRRHWRHAGVAMIAAVAGALPWLLWTARRPPATGGYLQQVRSVDRLDPESAAIPLVTFIDRAWDNLSYYVQIELPQLFWPEFPIPIWVRLLGAVLGVVLVLIGSWALLKRRGLAVWDLYLLATLTMLLLWPWRGDRFFLTLVPFVWLYVLTGLDRVSSTLTGRRWVAPLVVAALALVLLVGVLRTVPAQWVYTRAYLDGDRMAGYPTFWQDYFESAKWIGEENPQAVIAARKPTFAWYWSQRPSLVYPFHGDPDRTWRFMRRRGVTHIIVDPLTQSFLAPMFERHVDELALAYAGPQREVFVLRLMPGAE
jgi:4-amino-4-deoxy-L-arabinose transferase-like glycosyltransferase